MVLGRQKLDFRACQGERTLVSTLEFQIRLKKSCTLAVRAVGKQASLFQGDVFIY